MKKIPVEAVPEFKWLFLNCKRPDQQYFLFITVFNANQGVIGGCVGLPGLYDDDVQLNNSLESQGSGYPGPKARPGTTKRLPYTFVGSDTLPPSKWVRVPSSGKTDTEKREIERGVRPAEECFKILLARFGILRGTVPIPSFVFAPLMSRAVGCLHNYFMATNPAYANDSEAMMAGLSLTKDADDPLAPINNTVPRYAIDTEKVWMDKLHMDEDLFQCLLRMTTPAMLKYPFDAQPEMRLRMALRFMALSEGYDSVIEIVMQSTYVAINESLEDQEMVSIQGELLLNHLWGVL